jgi:hypothetical protein
MSITINLLRQRNFVNYLTSALFAWMNFMLAYDVVNYRASTFSIQLVSETVEKVDSADPLLFSPSYQCYIISLDHISIGIARWLIERSAVCPLCKMDLYEEEEEEESNSEPAESEPTTFTSRQSLINWWTGRSLSANRQAATSQQLPVHAIRAGISTQPTAESTEARSWWPFSLEIAPPEELHHDDTEPRPLSSSSMRTWFRRRRLQIERMGSSTELIEPLIATDVVDGPVLQDPNETSGALGLAATISTNVEV